MTVAEMKMKSKVSSLTTAQLCETFELTNANNDTSIPIVRGSIMDELEARDLQAFNAWMECEIVSDMDKPSKFFK
jgi:hypothetical protein